MNLTQEHGPDRTKHECSDILGLTKQLALSEDMATNIETGSPTKGVVLR